MGVAGAKEVLEPRRTGAVSGSCSRQRTIWPVHAASIRRRGGARLTDGKATVLADLLGRLGAAPQVS
jgi:hypothetical protein